MKKNAQYIFYLHISIYLIDREKGGGVAVRIFSIFYTHHGVPNEHMMTINFDTITNEVIYVIKTDEILLKKNRYEFSSAFIDQRLQIWFNVYLLTSYVTRFGL